MRRGKLFEPKLCPKCPRIDLLSLVKAKSYTRTPALETNVKLCAKLRALNIGRPCVHFPKTERLNGWFGKRKRRKRR